MFCTFCGAQLPDDAVFCTNCGANAKTGKPGPATPAGKNDPFVKWLVPVGRSGWAIAAGYLGLIFPPLALLCGILGLRDIKKHPNKCGKGRAWFGIVMGAIYILLTICVVVIGLLQGFFTNAN